MEASAVRKIVVQLEHAGIPVWLDGGWGIDALLGRQTRPHHDLDILVRVSHVPKIVEALRSTGFAVQDGATPHAFVLVGRSGDELDCHAVTFHPDGTGVHQMDNGDTWVFPADAFTGVGTIDGSTVMCLSAEAQVHCHAQGYTPTEKDFTDMGLLQQAFGVELPPVLRRA